MQDINAPPGYNYPQNTAQSSQPPHPQLREQRTGKKTPDSFLPSICKPAKPNPNAGDGGMAVPTGPLWKYIMCGAAMLAPL